MTTGALAVRESGGQCAEALKMMRDALDLLDEAGWNGQPSACHLDLAIQQLAEEIEARRT